MRRLNLRRREGCEHPWAVQPFRNPRLGQLAVAPPWAGYWTIQPCTTKLRPEDKMSKSKLPSQVSMCTAAPMRGTCPTCPDIHLSIHPVLVRASLPERAINHAHHSLALRRPRLEPGSQASLLVYTCTLQGIVRMDRPMLPYDSITPSTASTKLKARPRATVSNRRASQLIM